MHDQIFGGLKKEGKITQCSFAIPEGLLLLLLLLFIIIIFLFFSYLK